MEQMLARSSLEATGKKRAASSRRSRRVYRDLTEWQIAKRAMIDDKDAERLDRVRCRCHVVDSDSMDDTPPPTPTY